MELSAGTLLQGGEYEIVKKLGQGGFGITYLAKQKSLKRKVAIKEFFMKDYCKREEETKVAVPTIDNRELVDKFKDRFHREAQFTAGLTHTNIVTIYSIFEENDTVYYVMEYLAGGSLSDYANGRALPEKEAVGYVLQIAGALKLMHSKRENHLDVKPGNIMLRDKETAVLIDFGLTKVFDDKGNPLTTSSNIGYTPRYAPTDQQKGIAEFSPTVDIYALGATLYRLTVGIEPPFTDDILQDGLPSLPKHLSTAVREAITASMQPRRKDRPQSIDDFINILSGKSVPNTSKDTEETIVKPEPPKPPIPPVPPPPPAEPKEHNDTLVRIVLIAIAVILCFVIIKNCKTTQKDEATPPEITEEVPTEEVVVEAPVAEATIEAPAEVVSTEIANRTFSVNGVSFDMIGVEGGSFMMGSDDEDAYEYELVHEVRVSDFWIGETEVPQGLWEAVMGNNPSRFKKRDNNPVENVLWNDCRDFVKKLNELTEGKRPAGTKFRLPTEAEWEYAARGGKHKEGYKYSGHKEIDKVAWYAEGWDTSSTHQVAQKRANALGIYDMSGNVAEWCEDWYDRNYYSNSPTQDPVNTTKASHRVLRGGSWNCFDERRCRVSNRFGCKPVYRDCHNGMRLVLSSLH